MTKRWPETQEGVISSNSKPIVLRGASISAVSKVFPGAVEAAEGVADGGCCG